MQCCACFKEAVNLIYFFPFSFFLIRIMSIGVLLLFQRVESICESQTSSFLFFSKYEFSFFVTLLYWNECSTFSKNLNLMKYQNIHTRYIQYKHTVIQHVFYKWKVPSLSYLAVCFQLAKDARCKIKNGMLF